MDELIESFNKKLIIKKDKKNIVQNKKRIKKNNIKLFVKDEVNKIINNVLEKINIKKKKNNNEFSEIDINNVENIPTEYPEEFVEFCKENNLRPPKINSGNGKALVVMLTHRYKYFTRQNCEDFVKKFNIQTRDSIQLFNKHEQWGIKTLKITGKNGILYPYELSNKHKMRKNFKFDGSEEEKNKEIEKIKSTIQEDYINVNNKLWQLGHKNPGLTDNTSNNLVLQPPIQAKYKDDYIFIDTLTKIPLPKKIKNMIKYKELSFSQEQVKEYLELFNSLVKN